MSDLTIESTVVIRVGAPGAPYAVTVVRSRTGLNTGRLLVTDFDQMPAIGTAVQAVDQAENGATIYAPIPQEQS